MTGAPAPRIAVVDYGMGNRRSVLKALAHVGASAELTRDRDELRAADGLVVPGVGAFPLAMGNLQALGLAELICECAGSGTPILGICLGMQLLFDGSDELEPTPGLGLIGGQVRSLRSGGLRVPHIGWNGVTLIRDSPLSAGLPVGGCPFYHVHSLTAEPDDPADLVGTAEYGERFATIVQRGLVFGVQFHPEKSSAHGLQMLQNFVRVCAERPIAGTSRAPARGLA